MEKKGLCVSCINSGSCIFSKDLPVWQCEEFSCGNHVHKAVRLKKVDRFVSCEVATESE
ncbi:MAG: hypothetical protein JW788_02115 [Candidatus Omnitrophica bacterium]|nr:hypothetical protein [Candidatus Omnitrophota bacterium]